jgi:hypothetical protein
MREAGTVEAVALGGRSQRVHRAEGEGDHVCTRPFSQDETWAFWESPVGVMGRGASTRSRGSVLLLGGVGGSLPPPAPSAHPYTGTMARAHGHSLTGERRMSGTQVRS